MIKNIIIIAIILGLVVVSQQPHVKSWGQNALSWVEKTADPYTSKVTDLFENKVYPVVSGEVSKKVDIAGQEINLQIETQKEKISQSLAEKIKNYFSNIIDSIFFPNKINQPSSLLNSLDSHNSQNSNIPLETQKCIESCQLPKSQ
jgi:hypothetical protein